MQKKEIRLIGVAIIIGALAIGTYLYMESEEPLTGPLAGQSSRPVSTTPAPDSNSPAETAILPGPQVQKPEEILPKETVVASADPLITQQKELLKNFKQQIFLDINLPSDMKFDLLDLDIEDEIAAMQGNSPGKNMVLLAARKNASPQMIASFLQEQKKRIPVLNDYNFKISGDLKTVAPSKGSGLSKITIIPGGEKNGQMVYAALIERSDKRGSYVIVMEASPTYFESLEGDLDNMLDSIKTK